MKKLMFAVAMGIAAAITAECRAVTVGAKPGDDLNAKLKELRGKAGAGGGELVLEDGVYEFTKTLTISKADSNLTVRAKNPGKAVVMGGWRFRGSDMKPVADARLLKRLPEAVRGKCVAIDIPANVYSNHFSNWRAKEWRIETEYPILTVDTAYQVPAHWPNGRERWWWTEKNFVGEVPYTSRNRKGGDETVKHQLMAVERAKNWDVANSEAFIFGCLTGWGYEAGPAFLYPAPAGQPAGVLVMDRTGKPACGTYARGVFFNLMEEIDEPGEWSFDKAAKKLVLYPTKNFTSASLCAVATMRDAFVRIEADNARLEGLVFTAKQGGHAVVIDKCRGVTVAGCRFSGLVAGVTISGRDNAVVSCDFENLLQNAATLNGGDTKALTHGNNLVENCQFSEFGILSGGYADAVVVNGCGNRVSHCLMHGAIGHAVDFRGPENVMEYCRIYDVCRDHDDSGAVYANGPGSYGSVMRYNDVGSSVGLASGIYLDDFCCGVTLYGNILRNVGHFGVFLSGGRDITIANNIFTGCWGGIRLDNRGLFWDAWKDKEKTWKGYVDWFGLDKASAFSNKYERVAKWWEKDGPEMLTGPVDNAYLDNLFVDNEGLPTSFLVCLSREIPEGRMTFKGNLSVRTKGLEPGKSDMASGDPKKVPDNKHTQKPGPNYTYTRAFEVRADGKVEKGCERIRVLDGTPENPIDLGFVNLPTCIFDLTGFYWEQQGWVNEEALREKRQKGYAMRPFEVGDLSLKPDARLLKEMPGFKPIPFGKIGLYRDKYRTDASLPARPEPDPMPDLQTAKSWWKLW